MASFAFRVSAKRTILTTRLLLVHLNSHAMSIRSVVALHLALSLVLVHRSEVAAAAGHRSNGFTLGRRRPGDEVIEQREEVARGSPDYALSYARTYVGSNEHLVTQIVVDDLGHGGTAALVAGGPDKTFVTLSFTILRRSEMHFNVTVYGKLPPYRKVV